MMADGGHLTYIITTKFLQDNIVFTIHHLTYQYNLGIGPSLGEGIREEKKTKMKGRH